VTGEPGPGVPAPTARTFPVLGAASCAVFALSAVTFLLWWFKYDVVPVTRKTTLVTPLTEFLESWTRNFLVAAGAGIVLGVLGAWRGAPPRTAAVVGLALNVAALVIVLTLTSTGTYPPDVGQLLRDLLR
jgi:hypothetical protein